MNQQLKETYTKALLSVTKDGLEIERISQSKNMLACYLRMYAEVPHFISSDYESLYNCVEEDDPRYKDIDPFKTMQKIEKYLGENCVCIRNFDSRVIVGDHFILTCDEDSIYGCFNQEHFPTWIDSCIIHSTEENKKYMSYVTSGSNGFSTMDMEVQKTECDIQSNYNDDLPYNKIMDFIEGDESGLIILHGKCGSGNFIKIVLNLFSNPKIIVYLCNNIKLIKNY